MMILPLKFQGTISSMTRLVFLFVLASLVSGSDDDESDYQNDDPSRRPEFVSIAKAHIVRESNDVTLPCTVKKLGEAAALFWKKLPETILFTDQDKMSDDDRYSLVTNDDDDAEPRKYDLVIRNVEIYDSGTYACEVSTPRMSQEQVLDVQVAPSVSMAPDTDPYIVEPGSNIKLTCYPTGNPHPTVAWKKLGDNLPDGRVSHTGNDLTLESVSMKSAGRYQCTASNGVGRDAVEEITIEVHSDKKNDYAPWVESRHKHVVSKEGSTATLSCTFGANPSPSITWTHNGYPINIHQHSGRISSSTGVSDKDSSKTTLQIRRLSSEDVGDYVCSVSNVMGSAQRKISLSFVPGPVEIVNADTVKQGSIFLTWQVASAHPINEFVVEYRKVGQKHWQKIHITGDPKELDGHKWEMSYNLDGLEPGSTYELLVKSRNTHGWGAETQDSFKVETYGDKAEKEAPRTGPSSASSRAHPCFSLLFLLATAISVFSCALQRLPLSSQLSSRDF